MFSKAKEVDVPTDLITKRLVPISKLDETDAVPLTKMLPPIEAVLINSKPES